VTDDHYLASGHIYEALDCVLGIVHGLAIPPALPYTRGAILWGNRQDDMGGL
jgi:hypothetical protein